MLGRSLELLVTVLWLFRQDMFILTGCRRTVGVGTNLGTVQQETIKGLARQSL